jgi:hypothetical protein
LLRSTFHSLNQLLVNESRPHEMNTDEPLQFRDGDRLPPVQIERGFKNGSGQCSAFCRSNEPLGKPVRIAHARVGFMSPQSASDHRLHRRFGRHSRFDSERISTEYGKSGNREQHIKRTQPSFGRAHIVTGYHVPMCPDLHNQSLGGASAAASFRECRVAFHTRRVRRRTLNAK